MGELYNEGLNKALFDEIRSLSEHSTNEEAGIFRTFAQKEDISSLHKTLCNLFGASQIQSAFLYYLIYNYFKVPPRERLPRYLRGEFEKFEECFAVWELDKRNQEKLNREIKNAARR